MTNFQFSLRFRRRVCDPRDHRCAAGREHAVDDGAADAHDAAHQDDEGWQDGSHPGKLQVRKATTKLQCVAR